MVMEGNHLAYVANGHTNDGQITRLLSQFLGSKGVEGADAQFVYMPRSSRRELERLLRVGVKSIDLGVSSFLVAAQQIANDTGTDGDSSVWGAFERTARGIFGRGRSPQEIEAAADIQATLHLSFDGRSASELVPHVLSALALQVTDGPDEFKIITKDDNVITRDKLVIKREVNVAGDDISLDNASAFSALRDCLTDWRRNGVMEE